MCEIFHNLGSNTNTFSILNFKFLQEFFLPIFTDFSMNISEWRLYLTLLGVEKGTLENRRSMSEIAKK